MSIPEEYILPDIPEIHLLSLLVFNPLNLWILNLLDIKGSRFHNNLIDWKNLADICHNRKMRSYLLPDRWC